VADHDPSSAERSFQRERAVGTGASAYQRFNEPRELFFPPGMFSAARFGSARGTGRRSVVLVRLPLSVVEKLTSSHPLSPSG